MNVLFWAGLRGAVAVAMALALPVSVPERTLLQEITFGIVLFTLIVQGTTAGWVVRRSVGQTTASTVTAEITPTTVGPLPGSDPEGPG